MTRPLYVGIDVGTQGVRAVVADDVGEVHGAGRAALHSRRAGPRHEQDPEQWWRAVCAACRQALRGPSAAEVVALALDATSGTVVQTDAAGSPLSMGLMYDDTRAAGLVAEVNDAGGKLWAELGYARMQSTWALPKLLWLLGERGDTEGVRFSHQGDFLTRRLVGHAVPVDVSTALKAGCDLRSVRWPLEVFDRLGVPITMLPDLVLPGTTLGRVSEAAAEVTGLPRGALVVAGMTDGCAAQLAAGSLQAGSWNSALGTTVVLKGVTVDLLRDPQGVVYSHRAPDGGYLPGGASSSGAGAIASWLPGRTLDALGDQARAFEPSTAIAYPLASARGERFPFVAPDAVAFLLGAPKGDADLYAALTQGIAYVERLCFDYLHLLGAPIDGRLVLTGGASRSPYFCQLRADVLGRPVTLVDNAEPAAGMAVLAAYGAGRDSGGRRPLAEHAAQMVHRTCTFEPRAGRSDLFRGPYLRLVAELRSRGWLDERLAAHAHDRGGTS